MFIILCILIGFNKPFNISACAYTLLNRYLSFKKRYLNRTFKACKHIPRENVSLVHIKVLPPPSWHLTLKSATTPFPVTFCYQVEARQKKTLASPELFWPEWHQHPGHEVSVTLNKYRRHDKANTAENADSFLQSGMW